MTTQKLLLLLFESYSNFYIWFYLLYIIIQYHSLTEIQTDFINEPISLLLEELGNI